jgi:predicted GNAT family acetyltransferase
VTAVATLPEHRGRGLASAIVERLLADARDRGMRTGTLQASKAGAPVYERLGFADLGFIEMWELRAPGEPEAGG